MLSTGVLGRSLVVSSRCMAAAAGSKKIKKIKVANPVVDLDGDEMTRIIWADIKKKVGRFFGLRPQFLSSLFLFLNFPSLHFRAGASFSPCLIQMVRKETLNRKRSCFNTKS